MNINYFHVSTIILAVLKLTGHIDWSWWYVALPSLVLLGFVAFVFIVVLMLPLLAIVITSWRTK